MTKTNADAGTDVVSAVSASTGTIEGGEFHCYVHDLVTANTEEWYSHMESKNEDGKPIHTEDGTSECIFCHTPNTEFKNLPWTRPGTTKGAVCDSCKESQLRSLV